MATEKQALTETRISRLAAPQDGQVLIWDSKQPGLGCRVTASGHKSYVFQTREKDGRVVRVTIGNVASYSLQEARERARELRHGVDKGISARTILEGKKAARKRKGLKVADIWADYCAATHRRPWGVRHRKDMMYLSRKPEGKSDGGVLWPLLQKRPSEIDQKTLVAWAKAASTNVMKKKRAVNKGKGAQLRQGFIAIKSCWAWALEQTADTYGELQDMSMFRAAKVIPLIPKGAVRNDVLDVSQISAWFAAVRKLRNPIIASYLQCLLLTGARRGELAAVKWTDVDFQWKTLHLKDKVEIDGRTIPLTPFVAHLIAGLPRRGEYVFSSPGAANGQLAEPRIAHKKALASANIPTSLSLHGLRRSFATLSLHCDLPTGLAAQVMGHRPSAVAEKHYIRRTPDMMRPWLEKYESWILQKAEIQFDTKAAETGLHVVV